ncbi:MAG: glycosyltransferase family 2 protein [bacterium]|nr:glycosyltransferase family 2 protein [bacterium]
MEQLPTILAAGLIAIGALTSIRLVVVQKKLAADCARLRELPWDAESAPRVVVLIPVLRETKIIKSALQRFAKLCYPPEKLTFIVITTEREFEFGRHSPHTPEVADEAIAGLNKELGRKAFRRLHYPDARGTKADQLNFALRVFKEESPEWFSETLYIGLYDADSVTPDDTLVLLAKAARQAEHPGAYQQPTLYFGNFSKLPATVFGALARSFAALQTVFSVTHEAASLMAQSKALAAQRSFFRLRMRYCVGHGLFVRWSLLERIGLFPTPIEDTRLGHVLSYLKEDIRVLPVFDACEVTSGPLSFIKQTAVWFAGESLFLDDWKIAKKAGKVPFLYGAWISLYKAYRNGLWVGKGILFAAVEIALFAQGHYMLAVLVPAFLLWLPILTLFFLGFAMAPMIAVRWPLTPSRVFIMLVAAPFEYVLMSIGPAWGCLKFVAARTQGRIPALPKTEREQARP